jgi:hypothetical protein
LSILDAYGSAAERPSYEVLRALFKLGNLREPLDCEGGYWSCRSDPSFSVNRDTLNELHNRRWIRRLHEYDNAEHDSYELTQAGIAVMPKFRSLYEAYEEQQTGFKPPDQRPSYDELRVLYRLTPGASTLFRLNGVWWHKLESSIPPTRVGTFSYETVEGMIKQGWLKRSSSCSNPEHDSFKLTDSVSSAQECWKQLFDAYITDDIKKRADGKN